MKFIPGKDYLQMEFYTQCLYDAINQANEVRLIDLFVDSLNLSDYGFYRKLQTCLPPCRFVETLYLWLP